jgi:K+-transporting ATPase KdpF subunit
MTPVLAASGVDNLTAMVLAILLVVFLFVALIFPEKL